MKKLDERITSIEQIDSEFAGKTIDEVLDELFGPEESDELDELDEPEDLENEFEDDLEFETDADTIDATADDEFLNIEDDELSFDDTDLDRETDSFDDIDLDDFSDVFGSEHQDEMVNRFNLNDDDDMESVDTFPADSDVGSPESQEPATDPNFQGVLRTVMGANLVYKRQTEDGTFEELWIYNVGDDVKQEIKIRKAVLAGTDILPGNVSSQDRTQELDTYTVGNVQYLKITGLPN